MCDATALVRRVVVVLAAVHATADAQLLKKELLQRPADRLRQTVESVRERGSGSGEVVDDGRASSPQDSATAPDPARPEPLHIALDRSGPWAAACEADAVRRVQEHRPNAAEVVFVADEARQWSEPDESTGVEGTGKFLAFGAWNAFSYRCRWDARESKVTWGRVAIGR